MSASGCLDCGVDCGPYLRCPQCDELFGEPNAGMPPTSAPHSEEYDDPSGPNGYDGPR